jgi:hypothetical protein
MPKNTFGLICLLIPGIAVGEPALIVNTNVIKLAGLAALERSSFGPAVAR